MLVCFLQINLAAVSTRNRTPREVPRIVTEISEDVCRARMFSNFSRYRCCRDIHRVKCKFLVSLRLRYSRNKTLELYYYYYYGVCMCCHPNYCGRTSQGHTGERPHRISPPSFCGACLHFSREKDSAVPFPRRP